MKPLSALRFLCWSIAAICLIFVAIGQLGRVSHAADALNQFAPAWLGLGLLTSLSLLVLSRARVRVFGLLTVCAGLAVCILGPELARGVRPWPTCDPLGLVIVDLNLWKENPTPELAANWIRAQKPDLVVLEEAAEGAGVVRTSLAAELPYSIDCLSSVQRCSTVIMSRVRPTSAGGLARGDAENRKALSAAWATFATGRGAMTLVGLHLDRPWPFGIERQARIQDLSRFLATTKRSADVVVGDFNETPWSFGLRRLDALIGLPRITRALPTWPTPYGFIPLPLPPILAIDHAYVGADLGVCSVTRGPSLGSDHFPLLIKLNARVLR